LTEKMKIAIAGLGTVGIGTLKLLQKHDALLANRSGRQIEVVAVSARNRDKKRAVSLEGMRWFEDPVAMAADADIDVFVELIGGAEGVAKAACEKALSCGKSVVTANKALLAEHGPSLAQSATQSQAALAYEAAVAGGIPVIKAVREGLSGNALKRVYGILNGTCNYMLTAMRETGRGFEDILSEAQELGYAEADPTFDVDGIDAAHKLAILASLGFGCKIDIDSLHIEGVRDVSVVDFQFAEELGYRIKLLGIAEKISEHDDSVKIHQRVHLCMVPLDHPIALIDGVDNAVIAEGDFVGRTLFQGPGAGEGPTASAVVSDLVDLARGNIPPTFSVPTDNLKRLTAVSMDELETAYYIRLNVLDKPGVIAEIAGALRDENVSIESVLQRARDPGEAVPVVMTTHETKEARMMAALAKIGALEEVVEKPHVIRIEHFASKPCEA